VAHHGENKGVN